MDGSDESQAVLFGAGALAKHYDAKLTLVHAVDVPRMTFEVDFTPFMKDLRDAADLKLREMKGSLEIDAHHILTEGNVADGVRKAAEDVKADLVVVGRGHAQGAFSRMWSHLYTIVREAPCPVLSI